MPAHPILTTIARELDLRPEQVARTVELLDEDNTVPFIARYRKEVTGSLDEEQIRAIQARLGYLRNLEKRKTTVLKSIADQDKLTPELEAAIQAATMLQAVEDLYLPYKPKRRTRATVARERGLEPLAEMMLAQEITKGTPEEHAEAFLSDEVPTVEDGLAGARDIVAEVAAEDAGVRRHIRQRTHNEAVLACILAGEGADPEGKYRMYHDFSQPLRAVPPHRLLAPRHRRVCHQPARATAGTATARDARHRNRPRLPHRLQSSPGGPHRQVHRRYDGLPSRPAKA